MDTILTYDPEPRPPQLKLPAGACDAHVHVFGPATRFPYAANRPYTPVDAPKEKLFALHRLLGIERCVIVQSTMHGLDNRVVEDAIAAGGGRYLGVALVPVDVPDEELARLAAAGFRGVRFNFSAHLPATAHPAQLPDFSRRLAAHRLHLQVHFDSVLVHTLAAPLAQCAVSVVIDHMGRVDAALGPHHRDFAALHALLQHPHCHVKVSGCDRVASPPPYADGVALARLLLQDFPTRCVWGTDWPHPNHTHVPDDAQLVDLLQEIAPDPAARQRLLVDNPQALYRFPA
ncbi:amidohydrolase family protein [Caenimonas terrae]|uniref:Amidohydrolase family protein n=1 Tax=Caenimonas terrae TaxID=696074 RepID=A0ABW0ND30_9BURK